MPPGAAANAPVEWFLRLVASELGVSPQCCPGSIINQLNDSRTGRIFATIEFARSGCGAVVLFRYGKHRGPYVAAVLR